MSRPNGQCAAMLVLGCIVASGCGGGNRISERAILAPANAIALTPLSDDRVAILAGNDDVKSVSLENLADGRITRSFGVSKNATGLVDSGPGGPLLISIAGADESGRSIGGIDVWAQNGTQVRTIPLPGPAIDISNRVGRTAYALIGTATTRAAIGLDTTTLATKGAVPLEGKAHNLNLCMIARKTALVFNDREDRIVVMRPEGARVAQSALPANKPTCDPSGTYVLGLSNQFASVDIDVFSMPDLLQSRTFNVSPAISSGFTQGGESLLLLDPSSTGSSIDIIAQAAIAPNTVATH